MTKTNQSWPAHRHRLRVILIGGPRELACEQRQRFLSHGQALLDRDLVVITADCSREVDQSGTESLAARHGLGRDRFEILLIGKDGGVKERRTEAIEPQEFFDCIDAMPLRIREISDPEHH